MVVVASMPWTYWLAPPMLAAALVLIVGLGILVLPTCAGARVRAELYEQNQAPRSVTAGAAPVHSLRSGRGTLHARAA